MYKWEHYTDKQLMKMKLKDLDINFTLRSNELINTVCAEVAQRGIFLQVAHYISTEWFTAYKSRAIAIPFYLFHPRLTNLEIEKTGWSEGNDENYFLKLLRHEIGHIIDDLCYDNYREKHRIFGTATKYPNYYTYKPYSKKFVKNLDEYYAQCCPEEDFAETFAVWLDPNSNWYEKYKNTPAIKKLLFIDSTIHEKTKNISFEKYKIIDKIDTIDITLGEYYRRKNKKYRRKVPKNTVII